MNRTRHICSVSLVTVGLALGATACGSSASSGSAAASSTGSTAASAAATTAATTAAADPLAGKSVAEIVTLLRSDMQGLTSVHSVGHGSSGGQVMSWDFHEAPGHGCYGSFKMEGGTISLVVDGAKAWVKMDDASINAMGLGAAAGTIRGKYIATSATNGGFAQMAGMCDLTKTMANGMKDSSGLTKGQVSTVDGAPVLKLTATDGSVITLSDTAHPYLLSITNTGSESGTITFGDFGRPITLTPPPASQVVQLPGA